MKFIKIKQKNLRGGYLGRANMLADAFAKHGLSVSTFALDPFQGDVSCIFGQLTLN